MTPLETLRRQVRQHLVDADLPSLAALARTLRDDTHADGWAPSTFHSVLRGDERSIPLMAALHALGLPACAECGSAKCPTPNVHKSNGDEW